MVEMIIVVIIIGIIASIAATSLRNSNDVARTRKTRTGLDRLAFAIAGNPALLSGGTRTDFGYVGDVGALPANLDALVTNPGLGTWNGPYIFDDLSPNGSSAEFKIDAWGAAYSYSGGNTISSSGGGSPITRNLANSEGDLLDNQLSAVVTDLDDTPPGLTYRDSVRLVLSYPNGTGSRRSVSRTPAADGMVSFDSVPIGIHDLRVIYVPDSDTLDRKVAVNAGESGYIEIQIPRKLW